MIISRLNKLVNTDKLELSIISDIYRLRPANSRLIEELEESYLWFSRPTEFNDAEDSNIFSFVENNESIKSSFIRLFGNDSRIAELAQLTGICCFSKTLPETKLWGKFRGGHDGVFIKYDKFILEKLFKNHFGLTDCFKSVEYSPFPTLFKKYSKHDILWELTKNGDLYKSLKGIEKDDKFKDELFLKMFTRINDRYSIQNEVRIILAGSNVPDTTREIKGYKIFIPKTAILSLYIHPDTPGSLTRKLKSFNFKINRD